MSPFQSPLPGALELPAPPEPPSSEPPMPSNRVLTAVLAPAILACSALAIGRLTGQTLDWAAEEGLTLERHLELTLEVEFDGGEMEVMGQRAPIEDMVELESGSFDGETSLEMAVTDTVRSVDDLGWPTAIVRRFDRLVADGVEEDDMDGLSEVTFIWDAERETYAAVVDDDQEMEPEERQMAEAALREDPACRWLLPEDPIEVGAIWRRELDVQRALELLAFPGLDLAATLAVAREVDDDLEPEAAAALDALLGQLERELNLGHVEATYEELREQEDGSSIAALSLAIVIELDFDGADLVREIVESVEDGDTELENLQLELLLEGEGEGELLWNLDGRRLHSLSTALDLTLEITGEADIASEGFVIPFVGEAAWGGSISSSRTVRAL